MLRFDSDDTQALAEEQQQPCVSERLTQVVDWIDSDWLAAPVPVRMLGEWKDARGRPIEGCRGVFACARLAGAVDATGSAIVRPGLRVSGFESRADAEKFFYDAVLRDQHFETALERSPHTYDEDTDNEFDAGGALGDLLLLHHRDYKWGCELVFSRADADIACARAWRPIEEDAQAIARLVVLKHFGGVAVPAACTMTRRNRNFFDVRATNIVYN